jgi:hypothetical protein
MYGLKLERRISIKYCMKWCPTIIITISFVTFLWTGTIINTLHCYLPWFLIFI